MHRPEIEARLRALTSIWFSMMLGTVSVAGVLWVISTSLAPDMGVIETRLLTLLLPWVVAAMAGGLLLGRRLQAAIPRTSPQEARFARYQAARIVTFAIQEAGGASFAVAAFLAGEPRWILAGAGIGVWGMLIARPKAGEVERLLRD